MLGLGCERGISAQVMLDLAESVLAGLGPDAPVRLAAIASLDRRRLEPGLLAVAAQYQVPFLTFHAARLDREAPRLKTPSARVHAIIGCHGVAEGAALAAAGPAGLLIVPKQIRQGATAAIAATDVKSMALQALEDEHWKSESSPSCVDSRIAGLACGGAG
ncbi:cobalamin biosynthesis protein [Xaviernesmea oryzae]|uniref:cobalamin biosynthesis protein n=1 Tax=Xaviernesmea oryzae TaxID=464029 RepID=UPI002E138570